MDTLDFIKIKNFSKGIVKRIKRQTTDYPEHIKN